MVTWQKQSPARWNLDRVPEGAFQLDWSGRIAHSDTRARRSGAEDALLDRLLFEELKPCDEAPALRAAVEEGVAARGLDVTLAFANAAIQLYYSDVAQSVWVFVKRR